MMRRGAAIRPQGFDDLFDFTPEGRAVSCPIGAALEGAGLVEVFEGDARDFRLKPGAEDAFADVFSLTVPCVASPDCPHAGSLRAMCEHANDDHRLTREEIADWVERFEAAGADLK